jgi:hypothetical protein
MTCTFNGQFSGSVSAEPLLTALPIKAGLFLKLPLSGKLHLTADLGAGYYRASLDNTYTWEITGVAPQTIERFKVSSWRPGFHGGVGLEYSIGNRRIRDWFFCCVGRKISRARI